jgi:ferredoxin-NADP reductase
VRWIKRSYSIASAPEQRDAYELFLAVVPGGLLTPRLFHLAEGDRVWCDDAPKGISRSSACRPVSTSSRFATGTGIAPFVSMLRRYRGTGRWRKLTIVWGSRASTDLVYDAEFRAAAAEGHDAALRARPLARAGDRRVERVALATCRSCSRSARSHRLRASRSCPRARTSFCAATRR